MELLGEVCFIFCALWSCSTNY